MTSAIWRWIKDVQLYTPEAREKLNIEYKRLHRLEKEVKACKENIENIKKNGRQ